MEGDCGGVVLVTMIRDGLLNASSTLAVLEKVRSRVEPKFERKVFAVLEQAQADSCVAGLAERARQKQRAQRLSERADGVFKLWDQGHRASQSFPTGLPGNDDLSALSS